jgi:hypothetical protein
MPQDGLASDVNTLKSGGKAFTDIGTDFGSALNGLIGGLAALEGGTPPSNDSVAKQFWSGLTSLDSKAGAPPWGDDEIGEKFGVVYEGLRDGMYESMGHLAAKLQEIGGALTEMATNHEANENFNESLMNQHIQNQQAHHQAVLSVKSPHHTV